MIDALDIIFHRSLKKALEEAVAPLTNEVLMGKFSTFDDYKHAAGRIAGLTEAMNIADAVQAKILKQDNVRES